MPSLYGPSLSCAEFVMCRVDPIPILTILNLLPEQDFVAVTSLQVYRPVHSILPHIDTNWQNVHSSSTEYCNQSRPV